MEDGQLRAWLMQSAHVPPTRIDALMGVLDEEEVDTVSDLEAFSRTADFDSRLKATTALKIRDALRADPAGDSFLTPSRAKPGSERLDSEARV